MRKRPALLPNQPVRTPFSAGVPPAARARQAVMPTTPLAGTVAALAAGGRPTPAPRVIPDPALAQVAGFNTDMRKRSARIKNRNR